MSKIIVNSYTKGYAALFIHMGVNLADSAVRATRRNIGWPCNRRIRQS